MATLYAYLEKSGLVVSDPSGLADIFETDPHEINKWLEGAAEDLLPALTAIICVINPGAILIGGRLPEKLIETLVVALEKLIEPLRDTLPDTPKFMRAKCSTDAAALGAAIIPFTRILFPAHEVLMKKAS